MSLRERAHNSIEFEDRILPDLTLLNTSIEFVASNDETWTILWRAKEGGVLKSNGAFNIEDAERLAFFLLATVDSIRSMRGPFEHPDLGTQGIKESIPKKYRPSDEY